MDSDIVYTITMHSVMQKKGGKWDYTEVMVPNVLLGVYRTREAAIRKLLEYKAIMSPFMPEYWETAPCDCEDRKDWEFINRYLLLERVIRD